MSGKKCRNAFYFLPHSYSLSFFSHTGSLLACARSLEGSQRQLLVGADVATFGDRRSYLLAAKFFRKDVTN